MRQIPIRSPLTRKHELTDAAPVLPSKIERKRPARTITIRGRQHPLH